MVLQELFSNLAKFFQIKCKKIDFSSVLNYGDIVFSRLLGEKMQLECPYCDTLLEVEEEMAGMNVECPICSKIFLVPAEARVVPAQENVVPSVTPQNNNQEDLTSKSRATRTDYWCITIVLLVWSYFFNPLDYDSILPLLLFAGCKGYWYTVFYGRLKDINISEEGFDLFWDKLFFISILGEIFTYVYILTGEYIDPAKFKGKALLLICIAYYAPWVCMALSFIVGFIDGTVGRNRYGADPRKRK